VSALTAQLLALGLTLREVPGDGNCMFRALSDQLHGGSDRHLEFRAGVVEFMKSNREDFEPFLVDETSFERHLRELGNGD
jgi:OTU domain-containing protein 3